MLATGRFLSISCLLFGVFKKPFYEIEVFAGLEKQNCLKWKKERAIPDRSSGESPEYIREAVRPLEIAGIRVIAVAVGKEVDVNETKAISSGGKAIETDNKKAAKEVGKEIVEEIAKGNLILDYVMLHMKI